MLAGCVHTPNRECAAIANGYSSKLPCWALNKPTKGLVLHGSKAVGVDGWQQAKQRLLRRAMLEFAIARFGEEVSVESLVLKQTTTSQRASGDEKISRKNQSSYVAEFRSHDGVNIQARIEDYFYNNTTETVYLWIIEK